MIAFDFKPTTKQSKPSFNGGYFIHDHEKRAFDYGEHFRPPCGYTEQILKACRMLRRGERVSTTLPFKLDRESRLYLLGRISDVTANTGIRFEVTINEFDLSIARRN